MQVWREQISHKNMKECLSNILKQIKNNGWHVEQCFQKIEREELLRIFPINMVIGARKVTEENKDRKKFSFLYKSFLFTTYRT